MASTVSRPTPGMAKTLSVITALPIRSVRPTGAPRARGAPRRTRSTRNREDPRPSSPATRRRRVMDGLMTVPAILLAIALIAVTRASVWSVLVAITIPEVPRVVRLVRGIVLTLREQPFVEAATALG